jgi:DNA-binding transcriptional ArsR family regulator
LFDAKASVPDESPTRHAVGMTELTAAQLIAEPARAAMLDLLMDGHAWPAGVLARRVGVAPSTASEHLARLAAGGLVAVEPRGRERRYRLASPHVADALEALARIGGDRPVRTLRESSRKEALRDARTCYDHLAGRLGVAITDALVERGALLVRDTSFDLTDDGEALLVQRLGVDIAAARAGRRAFARACLDWTERRPHLAGALGAALARSLLDRDWVRRRPADRGLVVTPPGEAGLAEALGI